MARDETSTSEARRYPSELLFVLGVGLAVLGAAVTLDAQREPAGPPGVVELGAPLQAGQAVGTVARDLEVAEQPPPLPEDVAGYIEVLESQWRTLVSRPPAPSEREAFFQFDDLFRRTGRYLEFVEVLEHVHTTASLLTTLSRRLPEPMRSPIRQRADRLHAFGPMLVWARWNVGAQQAALELSTTLLELLPRNADVQMVRAVLIDQAVAAGQGDVRALRWHLGKVLELDPAYEGFGVGADDIRQRIDAINGRMGAPPPAMPPGRGPT